MTEAAQIDEHISGFKTSMEKLQMRLDEIKKEEETINQALKKYEGALEYANILRSQLPEKVVMNDVKETAPTLPTIPETKAEEEVKGKSDLPNALAKGDTGGVKQDVEDGAATPETNAALSGASKKKKKNR